ncbi:entry exclusion lipoprotein TrbK [Bartonella sp. DGB2]|uniref:entry exclusion lipoprotein TrbK n=1 Tax=Bartonella sp. DGB2 TaxID=3388426 RepID=UPI00398FEF62
MNITKGTLIVASFAFLLAGCEPSLPEANDETCNNKNIYELEQKVSPSTLEKFKSMCRAYFENDER